MRPIRNTNDDYCRLKLFQLSEQWYTENDRETKLSKSKRQKRPIYSDIIKDIRFIRKNC